MAVPNGTMPKRFLSCRYDSNELPTPFAEGKFCFELATYMPKNVSEAGSRILNKSLAGNMTCRMQQTLLLRWAVGERAKKTASNAHQRKHPEESTAKLGINANNINGYESRR